MLKIILIWLSLFIFVLTSSFAQNALELSSAKTTKTSFSPWLFSNSEPSLPKLVITVTNLNDEELRFPLWLILGDPCDMYRVFNSNDELTIIATTPPSSKLVAGEVCLKKGESLSWTTEWPRLSDGSKFSSYDQLSIKSVYFKDAIWTWKKEKSK